MDLIVRVIEAKDLIIADSNGTSDPYVNVRLYNTEENQKQKTKTIKKSLNPTWNEEFKFVCRDRMETVEFHVWDHDTFGSNDPLGDAKLNLASINNNTLLSFGTWFDVWLPLYGVASGVLHVSVMGQPRATSDNYPSFLLPPSGYSIPPLLPAIFIPPPPGYSGSNKYSPSQILTFEVCYKGSGLKIKRYMKLHGPVNIVTLDFMAACNDVIHRIVKSNDCPFFTLKESKKKPSLSWRTKITPEFQVTYQDDVVTAFLNLFEVWGWRFEKEYDVVGRVQVDDDGHLQKVNENQVFVFRRAVIR